jgi:hypothetical protein
MAGVTPGYGKTCRQDVLRGVVDYRWRRQARVRFQATRMQPNVRFSTLACSWSGYARHLYAVLTTGNLIRLCPDLWT